MITLLGAIIGFLTSFAPEILGFFKDSQNNNHEYRMLELQGKQAAQQHLYKLEEINAYADIAEASALNERVKVIGVKWVDALAVSVRPVITYAFFLLYLIVKIVSVSALMNPTLPWQETLTLSQALLISWNDEDMGLFSAVMAFWFGSRSIKQLRENRGRANG